ncbi:hypothetical protein BJ912DRAFT_931747 [Pholiota molesta]|nr:hypothetical protein BJ912DRAFT_931747 [Pholiota molesta]
MSPRVSPSSTVNHTLTVLNAIELSTDCKEMEARIPTPFLNFPRTWTHNSETISGLPADCKNIPNTYIPMLSVNFITMPGCSKLCSRRPLLLANVVLTPLPLSGGLLLLANLVSMRQSATSKKES